MKQQAKYGCFVMSIGSTNASKSPCFDTDSEDDHTDSEEHTEDDGIDWEDDDQVNAFMVLSVYSMT